MVISCSKNSIFVAACVTLTLHISDFPSDVVAIMYVFPALHPVTSPFAFTVAIVSSKDDQVTFVVDPSGAKLYPSPLVSPTSTVNSWEFNAIDSASCLIVNQHSA